MTVYIDIVLLENLIMNYIILYATGIVLKRKVKKVKIFLASLLGAIYSLLAYISTFTLYTNIFLKIILSIMIVYIAFNAPNVKQIGKDLLLFYLVSFVFGGAAFALIYIVKPQDILMKNGLFLGTYPLKTVLLGAIIAFVIVTTAFKIVKTKFSPKNLLYKVKISMNGKQIETDAMMDTGNLLKEPISNTPVIVVEHSLLYECLPKEILNHLEDMMGGDFEKIPEEIRLEYLTKLKLIPFSSLGKQNGMLIGIKPEYIIIQKEDEEWKKEEIIIGIYNKSFTKRGEYRALIGAEVI